MRTVSVTPRPTASRKEQRLLLVLVPVMLAAAAVSGKLVGAQPLLLVVPFVFAVPVLFWKRPAAAPLMLLGAATLIEQFPYTVGTHAGAFTDRIPFFRTPAHGIVVSGGEVFIFLALVVWIMKRGIREAPPVPKSPVTTIIRVLSVLLFVAMGVGMAKGAHMRDALWELRPWLLLIMSYFVASTLLTTRKAFNALLWTLVLGSGFKALQGVEIYFKFARRMTPRPEAILGHEESFFFGLFVIVTAALWLYEMRGALRTTATCLLPFVFIANMANSRRTAWLILPIGVVVLLVVARATLHRRRIVIRRMFIALLVGSAFYLPVFWNNQSTIAQPARAVRSAVKPDKRDVSSDLYRKQENVNLLINIRAAGPLGKGFGVPIIYSAPIVDISSIDPMIKFIPHNGLMWVWMRLGIQGEIVLWCLIAAAMIRACGLARARDPLLALIGAVTCCAVVEWVLMGYNDMGFAWFRIAVAMGCLLGAVEAGLRMVRETETEPAASAPVKARRAGARRP